tara:strand:+ start:8790 stop:9425 length:636 start_codon:yes stop_codon:yes gene_type:complete
MKKILLLFVGVSILSCQDDDTLEVIDTSVDYTITVNNGTELVFNLQSLDTSIDEFIVTSYTPNTSCCLDGTFVTENNVDASVDGASLSGISTTVASSFSISLNNFNEGMNYYTIELNTPAYKKYFSFQFNLENGAVDYLAVVKNSVNDNKSNYEDAIFRFDFYTDSSMRVLQETEGGINVFVPLLENESNTFSYITSGAATNILKTSKENL